jgi:hypothetical protein
MKKEENVQCLHVAYCTTEALDRYHRPGSVPNANHLQLDNRLLNLIAFLELSPQEIRTRRGSDLAP